MLLNNPKQKDIYKNGPKTEQNQRVKLIENYNLKDKVIIIFHKFKKNL